MPDEKEQDSPTADEEASEEGGQTEEEAAVEGDDEASESDQEASASEDDASEADEGDEAGEEDESASAGVGGIFDVAESTRSTKRKSKKKKKQEAKEAKDGDEETTGDDKKKRKASTQSDLDDLAGVLGPSSGGGGSSSASTGPDDDYLLEDDLDLYGKGGPSGSKIALVLVVLAILGGGGFFVIQYTALGGDLVALFQGELRERRMAEAEREKQEFERKQREEQPKFGVLNLKGTPRYAELKLNGEVQYGQVKSGQWRELRLDQGTTFENIPIKEDHTLEASANGFKDDKIEISEGMWDEGGGAAGFTKHINFKLVPESTERQLEFEQRMDTEASAGSDQEYNGEVTINSEPEGARVIFNNEKLVDKDGEELKTPVTFDKYYVEDEDDEDELEVKTANVSTPPDRGDKIELEMPDGGDDSPEYITMLDRRMWECEWKDDETPEDIPDDKTYRDYCDYTFELNLDFDELGDYIERREEEKKKIEKERKELEEEAKKRKEEEQKKKEEETKIE